MDYPRWLFAFLTGALLGLLAIALLFWLYRTGGNQPGLTLRRSDYDQIV